MFSSVYSGVGLVVLDDSIVAAFLFDGSEKKSRAGSCSAMREHKLSYFYSSLMIFILKSGCCITSALRMSQ